jgi:hypothetical protein
MDHLQATQLVNRIEKLERQNVRYRWAAVTAALVVLSLAIMGQTPSKLAGIVEARSFVLRDKSGNMHGTLAVDDKTNASTLVLADDSGKIRTELKVTHDGKSGIAFGDLGGKPRLIMGLKGEGSPDMGFADSQGNLRIGIGLEPDGTPGIVIYDENGKAAWRAIWRKP